MDGHERWVTVALFMCPFVEPATIRRLIRGLGSAIQVWESSTEVWMENTTIRLESASRLDRWRRSFRDREVEQRLKREQIHCLLPSDRGYPTSLLELEDYPLLLFARGKVDGEPPDGLSIAVVGTRRASSYALEASAWISETFVSAGASIVSGLALGIDASAHRAAVRRGGRTIAVLGSGVDVCYPPSHIRLYEEIVQCGLVLSEYCPKSLAQKHRFPERNRLIAALSQAIVVVQAGEKSGALRTVDAGLEIGRDVYVVPGPITSVHFRGSHKLIQQGAQILLDPNDMLKDLGRLPVLQAEQSVPARWRDLYDLIADTHSAQELADRLAAPIQMVYAGLLELELEGFIRKQPGGIYTKVV